jgi:protein phosphatase
MPLVHEKLEANDGVPSEVACHGYSVAWVSACDPGKAVNEDAALVVDLGERGMVACAIDGMGGMANGREAAAITAQCVAHALSDVDQDVAACVRSATMEGLEAAHQLVETKLAGAGATVVAAIITPGFVQTLHVGDAEALLVGQTGGLQFRTVPHSPVGHAQDIGLLDETSALFHPERHLVSNGIGVDGMQIQIGPRLPLPDDVTVALCSDGVTDNAYEAEIVRSLERGTLLDSTTDLFQLCNERSAAASACSLRADELGKSDDITLLTIRRRVT